MGTKRNPLLTAEEKEKIVKAIAEAERQTSGEIRLRVERLCAEDVLDRAAWWFKKLKMHKTFLRNGVLIYVAVDDRKSAIIGDVGIHRKLGDDYWAQTLAAMTARFKEGALADGIVETIREVGVRLSAAFPYDAVYDKNELSDEISMEDEKE